jgi:hypothetical protein
MADVPGVEEFLRLEEASQQLLDELTALRQETLTFKEAHTTMSTVGENLKALVGPVADASRQLGESARALREIGTPELLAGQARHQEQVARMADLAVSHGEHLSGLSDQVSQSGAVTIARLDALDEHASQADRITQQQLAALEVNISAETNLLTDKLAATEQRLKSLDANVLRAAQTAVATSAKTIKLLKILGYGLGALLVLQAISFAWLIKS